MSWRFHEVLLCDFEAKMLEPFTLYAAPSLTLAVVTKAGAMFSWLPDNSQGVSVTLQARASPALLVGRLWPRTPWLLQCQPQASCPEGVRKREASQPTVSLGMALCALH